MTLNFNIEEPRTKTHSQDFIPSFIRKTYDILEEGRFPQFIDWSADGTAIVIKKPSEFSQKVLPVYFKHNNFTSFVRQLNMYNFHKRRTQTLDHIYVHELFQQGKRHLLQEIKRKIHDHVPEKVPKVTEIQEVPSTGDDMSTLFNENQFLKRLYTEAMNRLSALENQAKELAAQNQALKSQVNQKNERTFPTIVRFESQSELTQDQLPMTLGKISLNFSTESKAPTPLKLFTQSAYPFAKAGDVNGYVSNGEESSGMSTLSSRNSPLIHSELESEEYNRLPSSASQKSNFFQFSNVSFFPNSVQGQSLNVSRQEISVGKMLETWNFELETDDMLYFSDQKIDRGNIIQTTASFQEKSTLGKRPLNLESQQYGEVLEPSMKRPELCICTKKSVISDEIKDKESGFAVMGGYDLPLGINLMDY